MQSLLDVNMINRYQEVPLEGLFCDLLWADPCMDRASRTTKYIHNAPRECSYKFGLDPLKKLLKHNNYLSVFRAHEVQMDGYKFHRWGGSASFPSVITVFSAPNYCGHHGNKGAVVFLDGGGKMQVKQFREDHSKPYRLPSGLNSISWSAPFLAEKVSLMLQHILKKSSALKTKNDGVINIKRYSFDKPPLIPQLAKVFSSEVEELEWEMLKKQVTMQRTITEDERLDAQEVLVLETFESANSDTDSNLDDVTMKKVLDH